MPMTWMRSGLRWLIGRGERPLRLAQRYFVLFVMIQVWAVFPQTMDLELQGPRPLIALLVVAAVGALVQRLRSRA